MTYIRAIVILAGIGFVLSISPSWYGVAFAQSPVETTPPEHKRTDPQQAARAGGARPDQAAGRPTSAKAPN
jgi:hypothetical protein